MTPTVSDTKYLGRVVQASVKEITVLLAQHIDSEQIRIGSYVVVTGGSGTFLCMVSDIHSVFDRSRLPGAVNEAQQDLYAKMGMIYTEMRLKAYMFRANGATTFGPVYNVPGPLRTAELTDQDLVNAVFTGQTRGSGRLDFGAMTDMPTVTVSLDLHTLLERSTGIFGKSGTGKTFLSRILLAGMLKDRVGVSLIFDMHNEYGWEGTQEGQGRAKGLRQLFPDGRLAIFTLDEESSRRRRAKTDYVLRIPYTSIEPEDIEALQVTLDLSDVQIGAVYALNRLLGKPWLQNLLDDQFVDRYATDTAAKMATALKGDIGMRALAQDTGQPLQTLEALRRKLRRFQHYGFLDRNSIDTSAIYIMQYLDAGNSIVLEFGRYGNDLDAYIFVANFLTRRIHQMYVEKKEAAFGSRSQEPEPLVIVIEEAHKFLDPRIANRTIFGTIAREMRKYNVTLLVIDQRPSQIDGEIMSQIATRVVASITDEQDIQAVLGGVTDPQGLRGVLARLQDKRDVLIFGYAVPLPVAVTSRVYGPKFFKEMGYQSDEELVASSNRRITSMRGPTSDGFD